MLFNSFTYLVFLPIVVALYWVLPAIARRVMLLIASYVFYMHWKPAYGLLIFGLTIANFFFGIAIDRWKPQRKPILTAALLFNLGSLCFFKYADFLLKSVFDLLHFSGSVFGFSNAIPANSPALNILLPLGISFFTFEFIHYLVDVYRGAKPLTNFWWFALFAAFFPSQIAGPIKRFQDFDEQLKANHKFDPVLFKEGLALIFVGLFKKMVLGDNLGHVVAIGFNNVAQMGTLDAWLAAIGFTIQIYIDFSGYTDIGRGSAQLLGFRLPPNFNWPFLSHSLTEFWRRWHISLSTWLRDYLYIPLGGNRHGRWQTYRNLMLTMLLGGLWHGASWNFVIWGGYHGALLSLERILGIRERQRWSIFDPLRVALTFALASISWIFFRAATLRDSVYILRRLCSGAHGHILWLHWQLWFVLAALVLAVLEESYGWFERLPEAPAWVYASAIAVCLFCLELIGFSGRAVPFVYFQF